jgi:hypothetical protein
VMKAGFQARFNTSFDYTAGQTERDEVLAAVRARQDKRNTERLGAALTPKNMFAPQRVMDAIDHLQRTTTPGGDGITAEFLKDNKEALAPHLCALFNQWVEQGYMNDEDSIAVITPIYKQKGMKEDDENYRPISVTTTVYRTFATTLCMALMPHMADLLPESQIGFLAWRDIGENIDLLVETLRYVNHDRPEEGGLFVLLDNEKAFDLVRHEFMMDAMHAHGIPESFTSAIKAMYTGAKARVKVNGQLSETFPLTASVRQGCPLSPLLFLFAQEVQLHIIRTHPGLQGIRIPDGRGEDGPGKADRLTVRSLADDMVVLLCVVSVWAATS